MTRVSLSILVAVAFHLRQRRAAFWQQWRFHRRGFVGRSRCLFAHRLPPNHDQLTAKVLSCWLIMVWWRGISHAAAAATPTSPPWLLLWWRRATALANTKSWLWDDLRVASCHFSSPKSSTFALHYTHNNLTIHQVWIRSQILTTYRFAICFGLGVWLCLGAYSAVQTTHVFETSITM